LVLNKPRRESLEVFPSHILLFPLWISALDAARKSSYPFLVIFIEPVTIFPGPSWLNSELPQHFSRVNQQNRKENYLYEKNATAAA
jgi:hypothetical protein